MFGYLPKKGEIIRCDSVVGAAPFMVGAKYTVEHIDRKIGYVYVCGDEGDMEAIDYPNDAVHGKFSKVS